MTSARGRTTSRFTGVVVASGLLAVGVVAGAGPAQAGGVPEERGGVTATLDGLKTYGKAVVTSGGKRQKVSAGLSEMSVHDGGSLQTYGIDMLNPTQEQARYEEGEWKTSSLYGNRNAGRIRWITQHSFPRMNDLEALAEDAGAKRLTPRTAATGTQVAIWRLSETPSRTAGKSRRAGGAGSSGTSAGGKGRTAGKPVRPQVHAVDPAAEKLADHLVKVAKSMPEPAPSLALDPGEVAGKAGDRLGPVTVRTNAAGVAVAPAPDAKTLGVRVVDKKGKAVDSARNGTKLYFEVPEGVDPGTSAVTALAATKIPVGRTLTAVGERGTSQTQILAGASQSTVSAAATLNWADKGAIPAASAAENCAKGGVDVTVGNRGDAPFRFGIENQKQEIASGRTGTITVPVKEDQHYRIPVTGPNGYKKTFSGVLDCETVAAAGGTEEQTLASRAAQRPATVGGGDAVTGESGDLAETGSGNTPVIVGVALAFVFVGGLAVFVVRRNGA